MQLKTKEEAQTRLTQLKQKAGFAVGMAGLQKQRARVAVVLDASGSMIPLYEDGTVQQVCARLLALAMQFDDNGAADSFLFDTDDKEVGEIFEKNFFEFTTNDLLKAFYKMRGGTSYAGVIKRIVKKYSKTAGDPAYVLFITDGDNSDKKQAESAIAEASKYPIFWQFVGIGKSKFDFLEKLDTMQGRFIDNANFFAVNDINAIADEELYRRMLGEFTSWLKLAKEKGLY